MRRLLVVAGWLVAAVLIAFAVAHAAISPINPAQKEPKNHFSAPCWTCHLVTSSAQLQDVK